MFINAFLYLYANDLGGINRHTYIPHTGIAYYRQYMACVCICVCVSLYIPVFACIYQQVFAPQLCQTHWLQWEFQPRLVLGTLSVLCWHEAVIFAVAFYRKILWATPKQKTNQKSLKWFVRTAPPPPLVFNYHILDFPWRYLDTHLIGINVWATLLEQLKYDKGWSDDSDLRLPFPRKITWQGSESKSLREG